MGGDHLFLNVNKTKELIMDVKKIKNKEADPLHISAPPFREGKTLKQKSLTFWILNTTQCSVK